MLEVKHGPVSVCYDSAFRQWTATVGGQDPLWLTEYEANCLLDALADAIQRSSDGPLSSR